MTLPWSCDEAAILVERLRAVVALPPNRDEDAALATLRLVVTSPSVYDEYVAFEIVREVRVLLRGKDEANYDDEEEEENQNQDEYENEEAKCNDEGA